jgi:hypothetical protein
MQIFLSGRIELQPLPSNVLKVEGKNDDFNSPVMVADENCCD